MNENENDPARQPRPRSLEIPLSHFRGHSNRLRRPMGRAGKMKGRRMSHTKSITKETATDIALAYREIERAQELLEKVEGALSKRELPDLRDAFGRQHGGLQLGVPSGQSGHTIYNVPWNLCGPILRAHIAHHRNRVDALTQLALLEMGISQTEAQADE
jgi:hypothetical protein